MKIKLFVIAALVAMFAVPAQAQFFEGLGNPIVVAGGTYQFEAPEVGSRAAFLLTANIAGVKLGNYPVYFGGVGVALPTVVSDVATHFGNYVMLSIPGITWYPKGNDPGTLGKVCLQAGYSYVLNGEAKARSGIYAGVGFGWDSPAYLRYKREMKKAKKAAQPPPKEGALPPNPYDIQ